jgi:hypothetical protein
LVASLQAMPGKEPIDIEAFAALELQGEDSQCSISGTNDQRPSTRVNDSSRLAGNVFRDSRAPDLQKSRP